MPGISLELRAEIGDRIHRFYHLVDTGHAGQTASLFSADASLTFGPGSPKPGTILGPDIAAAMAAREAQTSAFTRHVISNLAFTPASEEIDVRYLLTLYRSDDDTRSTMPAFVADVEERWRASNGDWLIAARTISPAFARS